MTSYYAAYDTSSLAEVPRVLGEISHLLPQELQVEIPGLIVVGDQSVGKTSLLAALSSMLPAVPFLS